MLPLPQSNLSPVLLWSFPGLGFRAPSGTDLVHKDCLLLLLHCGALGYDFYKGLNSADFTPFRGSCP